MVSVEEKNETEKGMGDMGEWGWEKVGEMERLLRGVKERCPLKMPLHEELKKVIVQIPGRRANQVKGTKKTGVSLTLFEELQEGQYAGIGISK